MRRKVFIVIAMMLIAAFVLSACGAGGESTKTEKIDWTDITPAKEITFWHNHSGDREKVLNKIVDDFNKTNEYGITVNAEVAGRYSEIYTKMMTVLNTTDVPDIVVGYQNQIAMY